MKLTTDTKAITSALALTGRAASKNSPKAIYQCVHLDASTDHGLVLTAGDAEISVRVDLQAVEVTEPGQAVVNAVKILDIAKNMDGPTFKISSVQDVMHITAKGSKFKVFGHPAMDYPQHDEMDGASYTIEGPRMLSMLKRVMVCMATDSSRYAISGVLFEREGKNLFMVATDGHRLSMDKQEVLGDAADGRSIIPKRAVAVLAAMIGDAEHVTVTTNDGRARFEFDGMRLETSLVEGKFPAYMDVIPKDCDKKAEVDVEALASACRRAALLTNEESKGVRLTFADGELTMSSRAPEIGEASITVPLKSYKGDAVDVGFNPAYVLDGLSTLEGTIELDLKSSNKPGVIRQGKGVYVVMPVSLQ